MRLFVSINFDEKTIERLAGVQRILSNMGRGRFVPPENLHLFKPHITLVRDYAKSRDFDAKKALPKPFSFPVSSFSLMRSVLSVRGAVYTELERYE